MADIDPATTITDLAALARLYGAPMEASVVKEVGHIHPHYRAMIERAPFFVLATVGAEGLDASPRGDAPGFVAVEDERTLLIPDRRGNNRIDSLRNIVRDPRVALLFLIPGVGEALRVNGRAAISVAPALLARFAHDGKPPRSVLVVTVEAAYFQCARAIARAGLWDPARRVERASLASVGTMLADISQGRVGGPEYDAAYPERFKNTLY